MFIRQISYVLALQDERRISAAAKRLGISQSTMSKFLKRLETELGYKLFVPIQGQLELTSKGRIYIEAAQSIQAVYEKMSADIERLREPS